MMLRPSHDIIGCTPNLLCKLVGRPLGHLQKISQRYTWHVTAFRKRKNRNVFVIYFYFFVNKS